MEQKNKKIIISLRNRDAKCAFSNYSPYGDEKCYEVYKMLLSKYNDVFTNKSFISFLKGISYEYDNLQVPVFNNTKSFNFNTVLENENFSVWITSEKNNEKNKKIFIDQLIMANGNHLIRKHNTEEIYVVPLLNDLYQEANVNYIKELVNALRKDDDDLWLLLHDQDLYEKSGESYHRADVSEFENKPAVTNSSELKTLIENNKVFAFIHKDSDRFFSEVIKKLDELTLDDIIKELEKHKRVDFAKKIAMKIKKEDMTSVLEKASETYDFSKQFFEL